jgi:hypothetical protein
LVGCNLVGGDGARKKPGRLNKNWLAILTSLFVGLMLLADYLTRYDPLVLKLAAGAARVLRPEI